MVAFIHTIFLYGIVYYLAYLPIPALRHAITPVIRWALLLSLLLLVGLLWQCQLIVFHWSLSDCKSSLVSRTLLSILTDFNNAIVWMVSARPPISNSSWPFSKTPGTVPGAPVTIGITITPVFDRFLRSLARSKYLSLFLWFSLCGPLRQQSSLYGKFSFFVNYYSVWSCEFNASHFPGQILIYIQTIYSYGQISISCTVLGITIPHKVVSSLIPILC